MSEPKLLRCPLAKCGGQGDLLSNETRSWVVCNKCGLSTWLTQQQLRGDPVETWNERTPTPPAWQPIETAPRDETEILVISVRNGQKCIQTAAWWGEEYGGWRIDDGQGPYPSSIWGEATHWMPLPEPPKP